MRQAVMCGKSLNRHDKGQSTDRQVNQDKLHQLTIVYGLLTPSVRRMGTCCASWRSESAAVVCPASMNDAGSGRWSSLRRGRSSHRAATGRRTSPASAKPGSGREPSSVVVDPAEAAALFGELGPEAAILGDLRGCGTRAVRRRAPPRPDRRSVPGSHGSTGQIPLRKRRAPVAAQSERAPHRHHAARCLSLRPRRYTLIRVPVFRTRTGARRMLADLRHVVLQTLRLLRRQPIR